MSTEKFTVWFSDLKRAAVEHGFPQDCVDQWSPKGWETFFALGLPARKALRVVMAVSGARDPWRGVTCRTA